jgi:hypothetical protein
MAKLDGTEQLKPTPFDAHEQVVRGPHTHSNAEGYQTTEAVAAEYPKAVAHDKETGEPVVVKNAEEEAAWVAAQGKE